MNRVIIFFLFYLLANHITFAQTPANDPHWKLKWEDQFSTFDKKKWKKAHNCDHGNCKSGNEPQLYLEQNVWVADSNLVIQLDNSKGICPPCETYPVPSWICGQCKPGLHNYTSGWAETKAEYNTLFGYIEARIKFPWKDGKTWGFWPAFWTFLGEGVPPPKNPAEIDIFEVSGGRHPVSTFTTNIHTCYENSNYPNCDFSKYHGEHSFPNYKYSDWHTYAIEWNKDRIIWYMDGKAFRTTNNHDVFNPVALILNVGVDRKHLPPTSGSWAVEMRVDYVKVYSLKCDKNTVVTQISNFNTYNYAVKKSISLSNTTTIPAGSSIFLRATDFIELKPGFEVQTGRELYLDVTPCELTVGITNPPPNN